MGATWLSLFCDDRVCHGRPDRPRTFSALWTRTPSNASLWNIQRRRRAISMEKEAVATGMTGHCLETHGIILARCGPSWAPAGPDRAQDRDPKYFHPWGGI